jgi:hypothetical protein
MGMRIGRKYLLQHRGVLTKTEEAHQKMKKFLGTIMALSLGLFANPASAEILKNLKVSGSIDFQTTSARNVLDFSTNAEPAGAAGAANNDRFNAGLTRVLVNLDWDLLDDVHSQVTLRKNDRAWASVGAVAGAQPAGTNQNLFTAGAGAANSIAIQRANISIDKLFGSFDTTIGRQYYGEPGDLVIYFGPKDTYGLFVTAIDAVRMEAANDWATFSGMAGTTARTAASIVAAGQNNTNVKGFDVGWKNLPVKLNTYVWNRTIQAAGGLGVHATNATAFAASGVNDNLYVYGLKLRGEAGGGWVGFDFAQNAGDDRTTLAGTACTGTECAAASSKYTGRAVLVDFGYNFDVANMGGLTAWGNFGWGTGRSSNLENRNETFTAIASDYRPGVLNRRFAGTAAAGVATANLGAGMSANAGVGTNGLGNRVVLGTGMNFTPANHEQLTLGASIWSFRFQRGTFTSVTGPVAAGNKNIGTEIGLTADWRHSDNVNLGMGWATFQPGGFIKESIKSAAPGIQEGDNPAILVFADLSVRF